MNHWYVALVPLLFPLSAQAQSQSTPLASPVVWQTSASLSATTASARAALPADVTKYPAALLINEGAVTVFYKLGDSSVTAATTNIPIEPGQCVPVWVGQSAQLTTAPTHIAAITGSGTAMLRVVQANSLQACGGSTATVTSSGTATVTPVAIAPVAASTALESSHVLKAGAGNFFGVQVNTTSAAEFVMLFDLTAVPSNGAVTPKLWWQVPANTTLSISENPGITLGTGIVIACSTTGLFTLTLSSLCTFAGGIVQ